MSIEALFLAPNLGVGGAERQWSSLLRTLASEGVRPQLLTLDGTGPFYDEVAAAGVPVACENWTSRWKVARNLPRLARRPPCVDVIVARGFSAVLVGSVLAATHRIPLVVCEHTDYQTLPPAGHRRWLLPFIARRIRHVIAISETQLTGLVGQGYPREAVHYIPNGVPAPTPPNGSWRLQQGISENDIVVTVGAALRPEKRLSDFVRVIAEVRRQGVQILGVVAGGGPDLESYRRLADKFGGTTRFLGSVDDIHELLASTDIACLVSEHEVMSMFLLEALAQGLPLVATDVGASADICQDGVNGSLSAVGDLASIASGIAQLANDPALRKRYGTQSIEIFQRTYDVRLMTRRYADYFRAVATR